MDGFGDYMKHSFHSQFIVLRRGITFTQMARNLENAQLLCSTKCAQEKRREKKKKNDFKDRNFFFTPVKENVILAF